MANEKLPLSEQYLLTVDQASSYFHIGSKKIRQIISNNPEADFVLHNGNHVLIKRIKFEDFINRTNVL